MSANQGQTSDHKCTLFTYIRGFIATLLYFFVCCHHLLPVCKIERNRMISLGVFEANISYFHSLLTYLMGGPHLFSWQASGSMNKQHLNPKMQRLGNLLKWASNNKPFPSLHQACWFGWRAASCAWLSWTPQGPRCPPRSSRGLSRTSQQTVRKERRSVSAGPSLCPRPPPRTSTRASMPWCVQRNRPKSFPSPRRPASINTASQRPPSSYGQMWCRWAKACVWLVSVPTATSWPSGEKCVRLHEGPGAD